MNRNELSVRDLKDLRGNCHEAYWPCIDAALKALSPKAPEDTPQPEPASASATVAEIRAKAAGYPRHSEVVLVTSPSELNGWAATLEGYARRTMGYAKELAARAQERRGVEERV